MRIIRRISSPDRRLSRNECGFAATLKEAILLHHGDDEEHVMTVSRLYKVSTIGVAALLLAGCGGQNPALVPSATNSSGAYTQRNSKNEQVVYNFTGGNDGGNAATQLAL